MLQSTGWQGVGQDSATEKQQQMTIFDILLMPSFNKELNSDRCYLHLQS